MKLGLVGIGLAVGLSVCAPVQADEGSQAATVLEQKDAAAVRLLSRSAGDSANTIAMKSKERCGVSQRCKPSSP